MLKTVDHLVFIGRFQPFHQGHYQVVKQALAHAAKQVVILIGSANSPRSLKNPFTFAERAEMIQSSFEADADRICCMPLEDAIYNDHQWLINAQRCIDNATFDADSIAIIGHDKDESSYYLGLFPQYGSFLVDNYQNLSATPLRRAYFGDDEIARQASYAKLPVASRQFLQAFIHTSDYAYLKQQANDIKQDKDAWQNAPYPPSFITTDALIVQSGHILLIERAAGCGQGLYALPGGFVDRAEDFLTACVREVYEETSLAVDKQTLLNSLKSSQLFDAADRSQRGRTVTMVHYFELKPQATLPSVQGGDDAHRAFWLPLAKLDGTDV